MCILTADELADVARAIRVGKSPSYAILAKNSFGSICAAPTIRADAASRTSAESEYWGPTYSGGYLEAEGLMFILAVSPELPTMAGRA